MKVLVTGSSGLLGQEIIKKFEKNHEIIGIGRTKPQQLSVSQWRPCDLSDAPSVYSVVTRENPDLVVHCAAYNAVDRAEIHNDEAYLGNSYCTRNLALACQRFDTTLMSVSSDYVFDGENPPEGGYREFDLTRPLSVYGYSKLWGERFIQQLLNKFVIVRTSWLFGPSRMTFVDSSLEQARNGQKIPCLKDIVSAPTYTPDLAEAMLQLAESNRYGIYHLTNEGYCSRVELIEEVLRLHRIGTKGLIKSLLQSELKLAARRPAFSGMENLAWRLDGFKPLRSWQDALKAHFNVKVVAS